RRLAEKPMVPREAATLVETLARAIHVVHQAGIVHRDLQPRNVLITSDGTPKITDFGLAKLLDTNSECTASGLIMGTPSYIAPEQAGGHSREVGPAADIYALGAILYKALTGRPPFLGSSALETLKLVSTTEVAPPARLRPDVPKDLETICLKCLQKEPPKRYTSGEALAGDLRRFLEGRPITARPVGLAERFRRWCRRNPKMAAVATLLAATVLLAISVFVGLTYRHNRELRAEIRRTQIKAAEARHHYEEARSTIQAMLNRLDARRLDGVPQFMDLCREQREDASSFYDRILEVIDSADPEVRADTARAWSEASVLEYRLGHREQAEQSVRRALRLVEGMRADGRDHPEFLKIQIDCLMRLGAYMIDLERPEQAIATSRESVTLAERLTESAHDDQNYKSLLALCHHNHANALWDSRNASKDEPTRQRMVEEAKRHYQKAIEIRESLDPKVIPGLAQLLSQGYTNLGIVDWNEGQNTQAERDFGRADELLRSSSPEVLGPGDNFSLESSLLYLNWAGMLCTVGRFDEAIDKADDGLKWIDPYLQSQPNHLGARRACLGLHGNRAGALAGKGKHAESAREWARVIELSDRPVPVKPRVSIAIELAQAGDLAHALGHAQHVKSSDGISGQDCHNLAYLYSLCATAARGDQSIRPAQRNERVQSHIAEAVRWLKAAAKAGLYDDAKLLLENKNDPGFEILRDRPEFREIFGSSGPKP
ncbi:MAG TPA: protein kinase, partial [Isosphaeraceae bacterium]|nr:protein kinase [Isosphaeraceae bacterium]